MSNWGGSLFLVNTNEIWRGGAQHSVWAYLMVRLIPPIRYPNSSFDSKTLPLCSSPSWYFSCLQRSFSSPLPPLWTNYPILQRLSRQTVPADVMKTERILAAHFLWVILTMVFVYTFTEKGSLRRRTVAMAFLVSTVTITFTFARFVVLRMRRNRPLKVDRTRLWKNSTLEINDLWEISRWWTRR